MSLRKGSDKGRKKEDPRKAPSPYWRKVLKNSRENGLCRTAQKGRKKPTLSAKRGDLG